MRISLKLIPLLLLCSAPALMAGVVLEPIPAPEWEVSTWLNDDPGSLGDHRGKVVLIDFFQLWCPGSREFSVPLLRRWNTLYGDREDVVIVLIHSVFEGHQYQTPGRLQAFVRQSEINLPVGVDAHVDGEASVPRTMVGYGAGGTPHLTIVDKEGMIRFSHFGLFDPEPVEALIDRLRRESPDASSPMYATGTRAEAVGEATDTDYSGTYVLRTDAAGGDCAGWIPRMNHSANLRFYRDGVDLLFAPPLLGVDSIKAVYDAGSGRIEGRSGANAAGGQASGQVVWFKGVLDGESDPPRLDVEFSLLDGKCEVQGRAVRVP
jgi:thiol-disulfide isomerase/thioredoxin